MEESLENIQPGSMRSDSAHRASEQGYIDLQFLSHYVGVDSVILSEAMHRQR